jgi:hypothetical protein
MAVSIFARPSTAWVRGSHVTSLGTSSQTLLKLLEPASQVVRTKPCFLRQGFLLVDKTFGSEGACTHLPVTPEEAIGLPLQPLIAIGNAQQHSADNLFVFGGRGEVHRLVQIV